MSKSGIFVSYRRDDSSGHAGRLYDRLCERFGEDRVFMDIDAIDPGVDFTEAIDQAVKSCSVLIALIGQEWLTAADAQGERQLDNPGDFVRLEIARALQADEVRVIPVLVQGATMPRADELPPDLAALARRNALRLSDESWSYDVGRLIGTIQEVLGTAVFKKVVVTEVPPPQPAEAPPPQPAFHDVPTLGDGGRPRRRTISPPVVVSVAVTLVAAIAVWTLIFRTNGDDQRPAGAQIPGVEGAIAFVSDKSGSCEIHLINAAGTGERRLTHDDAASLRPDWSPDGALLAYVSDKDGDADIYIVDSSDGSEIEHLDHPGDERGPDWSPEGDRIVFSSISAGHSELWVWDLGNADPQAITDDDAHNVAPDWSPAGDRIAFTSNVDGGADIHVMSLGGGERQNLTADVMGASKEFDPQWAPDGSEISFEAQPDGEDYDIWTIGTDGTDEENLTAHSANDRHSSWSPDGRTIVFGSDRRVPPDDTETGCSTDERQQDLFLMTAADGSEQRRLTRIEADDSLPAWGPAP